MVKNRPATGTIRSLPPLPQAMKSRWSARCTSSSRSPSTSQRRSPPSSIASTIAASRAVRSAANNAMASGGESSRGNVYGARIQRGSRPTSTAPASAGAGGDPRRHRAGGQCAPGHQIAEQPGQGRHSAPDRARRQPGLAVLDADDVAAATRGALIGDEVQHIGRGHLQRVLTDEGEEHLQVESGGEHRVRSAPGRDEPQVVIEQRVAQANLDPELPDPTALHRW